MKDRPLDSRALRCFALGPSQNSFPELQFQISIMFDLVGKASMPQVWNHHATIKPTSSERKMKPAAVCNMPCSARIMCVIYLCKTLHAWYLITLAGALPPGSCQNPAGELDRLLLGLRLACVRMQCELYQLVRFICHRFCLRLASGIGSGNSTAKHARAVGDLYASENFNKTLDSI